MKLGGRHGLLHLWELLFGGRKCGDIGHNLPVRQEFAHAFATLAVTVFSSCAADTPTQPETADEEGSVVAAFLSAELAAYN